MIPKETFLAEYLSPKGNEQKRHKYYHDSCQYANELLIHFDGLKPGKLLTERRPSESETIQKFREQIFKSKTKAYCDKIMNSLMKIRKSQDWMIKYPEKEVSRIAAEETLEQYMEKNFPRYESFTNWYFQIGFKVFLTDTNAVCLWKPLNEDKKDNEYYKPYPFVFKSEQVIDYKLGEWYLLLSEEKNVFTDGKHKMEGFIYYYADNEGIYTIKQINAKGGYSIDEFLHGLSYCPVVDFGGIVQKETVYQALRQSRVYGIVPSFDEAVREYSDLQAEVLQHIHSTMWAHEGQDCKPCKGTGWIPKKDAAPLKCKTCNNTGKVPFNPYEYYTIPRAKAGEPALSGVPLGYVQKQIDIAVLQDKRVGNHIKDGLSAINMEHLMEPPQLVESGEAKKVDKDDMHTFFHVTAEDVVRFFDRSYFINNDMRNSGIVPSAKERLELLPSIPVPEKYDILSETHLVQEIKMLVEAGASTTVITEAQKELANKKFFANEIAKSKSCNTLDLDPCASKSEESILMQLMNQGITQQDYTIHCNIDAFVTQALEENEKFFSLPLSERKAKMAELAKAKIKEGSAQAKVLQMRVEQDEEKDEPNVKAANA